MSLRYSGYRLLTVWLVMALSGCSGDSSVIDNESENSAGSDTGSVVIGGSTTGTGTGTGDSNSSHGDASLPSLSPHASGFTGSHFSGSGQCATCHDELRDESGRDLSMAKDWSTSMMANAARDPYWIAKVAAEIDRNPSLKDSLDDTCSRCHAPMANEAAHKDDLSLAILDEGGLLDPQNALFDHAMDGVSCTLCHQIEDDGNLGTPEGSSGKYTVGDSMGTADRPAYGPYVDPAGVFMQATTRFNPMYGPHLSKADVCAACHDLRTPAVHSSEQQGTSRTGIDFPEQMVYSEWRHSAYAAGREAEQTCQSCHMPVVSGTVMLATAGGGIPREGFSRHVFLGPNTVMQGILKDYAVELGVNASTQQFDLSITRNREFLSGAASVQILSSEKIDHQLLTRIRIDNLAGHKLPSGYPSRRVVLHFVVRDVSGNVIFESGAVNSDGSITGVATDSDSSEFEPHYDVISSSDQVQVYESIMGDDTESVTHTLMEATRYLKDNRLLPAGFDKTSAPEDIRTYGSADTDPDFIGGGDEIIYQVNLPTQGPISVLAELIYQPLAYGHLQDLFDSDHLSQVSEFRTLFDAAGMKAEILDFDEERVD